MLSVENLESIRSEGWRIADLAALDGSRPVPQYPDWGLGGLAGHVGSILARTTLVCRELPSERLPAPALPDGADAVAWFRTQVDEVLAALGKTDPSTPVWGFWPSSNIGLWERRMVIETGVHRWDAEQAFGESAPLTPLVARSGLDEFSAMWLPRLGEVPAIEVVASDLSQGWVYGPGEPVDSVQATASDLYLRLMSRPSGAVLPEEWASAVDGLEPPKR